MLRKLLCVNIYASQSIICGHLMEWWDIWFYCLLHYFCRTAKDSMGKMATVQSPFRLIGLCLYHLPVLDWSCNYYVFTSGLLAFCFFFFLWCLLKRNYRAINSFALPFFYVFVIKGKNYLYSFLHTNEERGKSLINQIQLGVLEIVNSEDCFSTCF